MRPAADAPPAAGSQPGFPPLPADDTALEREVLARWEAHAVVARALKHREDAPRSFVFYEGPPTANGKPGLHHVFARTLKDVVCRQRLMAGFRVPRKAGWDTQGLPVEIEVQKQLGISTRDAIEQLAGDRRASIAEFNRLCRESVFRYVDEWRRLSLRMGYWLDYEHPYVTCDTAYIESGWAILARLHAAGLLVRDFKVLWYCPRCQTGLSNHEVAQGYEDVQDPSVVVRFGLDGADLAARLPKGNESATLALALQSGRGASLLVWTTTPWTLPGNVLVAAHPRLDYAVVDTGEELLIVAESRREAVLGKEAQVVGRLPGALLEGLPYRRPLDLVPFPAAEAGARSLAGTVQLADHVSAEDGTGLVHTAPAFGADDFSLRQRLGGARVPLLKPVDDQGRFSAEAGAGDLGRSLVGRFVKDCDKDITRWLKAAGLLFRQDTLQHAYPHCWRCRSPLLSLARPSWYVRTTALRERLVELNRAIDWHPPEIGTGRFGEWLSNVVDWAISRERYWGTPLNVWTCDRDAAHEQAPESLADIGRRRGAPLPADFDPHKPFIDEVTLPCDAPGCGGTARRVPEVVDCWFDSGAMPFAQAGWPAATGGALPRDFPADFISEGLDQTRGWFYTLHVLSAFVADSPAYRSVLVNNLLLDAQARKMSKSRGNAVDPWALFDACGVDAVRWFFLAGGQVWTPRRFDPKAVAEGARRTFGTLRNCYAFLALYANMDGWAPGAPAPPLAQRASIDRWLVSRLQTLTRAVGAAHERYELSEAARLLAAFLDAELSNWYVRRNRARFWKGADDADKRAAFATLAEALQRAALLLAPITPFLAEWLWQATSGAPAASSVHLADWPVADDALVDTELERRMAVVLCAVELGRSVRAAHDLRTRQPLAVAKVKAADPRDAARLREPELAALLAGELNVRAVEVVERADFRTLTAKPDWKRLGPRFGPKLKAVGAAVGQLGEGVLEAFAESGQLSLRVEGEMLEFDRQDIVLVEKGREGYAVAGGGGLVLALDTRLDDDLLSEGRAREIVNRVQNARKAAGLEVSDRIVLRLSGGADLLAAARRHEVLILGEVLGTRLEVGDEPPAGAQEFDVDGARLAVGVERTG
jgi:isoleucyl-tRNA synthetase